MCKCSMKTSTVLHHATFGKAGSQKFEKKDIMPLVNNGEFKQSDVCFDYIVEVVVAVVVTVELCPFQLWVPAEEQGPVESIRGILRGISVVCDLASK